MKKTLLALVLVLGMVGMAGAVLPAYESITVADTAIGFTSSIYNNNMVTMVTCSLETAQIRFTVDGTTPTTTVGHPLETGQWICIGKCSGASVGSASLQISNFKAIRTGGSSGTLNCSFE